MTKVLSFGFARGEEQDTPPASKPKKAKDAGYAPIIPQKPRRVQVERPRPIFENLAEREVWKHAVDVLPRLPGEGMAEWPRPI